MENLRVYDGSSVSSGSDCQSDRVRTFLVNEMVWKEERIEMENTVQMKNQITEGVIWKQLLVFFFPIMIGTFFQQLYNTIDTVVVGQFVGTRALASVGGSSAQMINLVVGFFTGLSSGASVIIAQYYGARDAKFVRQGIHNAYAIAIVGESDSVFWELCWRRPCSA